MHNLFWVFFFCRGVKKCPLTLEVIDVFGVNVIAREMHVHIFR